MHVERVRSTLCHPSSTSTGRIAAHSPWSRRTPLAHEASCALALRRLPHFHSCLYSTPNPAALHNILYSNPVFISCFYSGVTVTTKPSGQLTRLLCRLNVSRFTIILPADAFFLRSAPSCCLAPVVAVCRRAPCLVLCSHMCCSVFCCSCSAGLLRSRCVSLFFPFPSRGVLCWWSSSAAPCLQPC